MTVVFPLSKTLKKTGIKKWSISRVPELLLLPVLPEI